MLYFHHATCISPQQTFEDIDLESLRVPVQNKLEVLEPEYKGIPAGALRRMGKAIRMGVGAAMPIIKQVAPDGIIIGTANGGMEDCIKFLNQIIEYDEGLLTPGNFVGSTTNAIAGQLGLIAKNHQYNITHVQSGLSFENALLDAALFIMENPSLQMLVGGVDEISDYNYNIDWLAGWYKQDPFNDPDFYKADSSGSIAGEGAAMFLVNGASANAMAKLDAIHFFHSTDATVIANELSAFLQKHLSGEPIDLFLTGENSDCRYTHYYDACEAFIGDDAAIARYKHYCGEFPTSSAIAVWLATQMMNTGLVPDHFIKKMTRKTTPKKVLIYNHYKALQQSFILLSLPE